MSSKKAKGGGGGWLKCTKCQRMFPRSLGTKHSDSECGAVFPFIQGGVLHTNLIKATTATGIQNLPFSKNSRLSSSTLFLPDELIRVSEYKSCSWVAVTPIDADSYQSDAEKSFCADQPAPLALRIWPIPESNKSGTSSSISNAILTSDGFLANRLSTSNSLGDLISLRIEPLLNPMHTQATKSVFPHAMNIVLELEDADAIDKSSFDPKRFADSFKNWFRNRLITEGNRFQIRFYAEVVPFRIKEVKPNIALEPELLDLNQSGSLEDSMSLLSLDKHNGTKPQFSEVTSETEVHVLMDNNRDSGTDNQEPSVTLDDVGGLDSVLKELCSTIKFIFDANMNVARGILLYGHSGVGKSFLVQALCNHFNLKKVMYDEFRPLVVTNNENKRVSSSMSSNSLGKVFRDAISKAPAAIVIENLDTLVPKKSGTNGQEIKSSISSNLISLVPTISSRSSRVIIIATATDVDGIDSSLRSPQIFGKEIELPVPSAKERNDILNKMLKSLPNDLSERQIKEIAGSTHGFVGADLQGLCVQAAQTAREMGNPDVPRNGEGDSSSTIITMRDLTESLKKVKPSAVKSILVDVPNVRWDDIGGQDELKYKLKQAIEWPLKHPDAFQRLGITPPKGVLMYGPPGCSKTMIAKAIATESGLNFISVKGSELFSKWVGESEKAVRDVFKKARQVAPCVVFFDEIDSLGGERGSTSGSSNVHERVLAQLLVEIDGIEPLKDVTIVAATNRPDIIDQALLRPGRLDRIIYVPLPDPDTRKEILKIRFKKMPVDPTICIEKLVQLTDGYSGAELTAISHEAAMKALEEDIESKCIQERHFVQALDIVKPRISKTQMAFYENYNKSHQRM